MLSSTDMPLKSARLWKVRAMPSAGAAVRLHVAARLAEERDAALLRAIDAVQHVQHRALAGAVGADDGAHLVLAHVEAHLRERLHPAEGERHVLHLASTTSPMRARSWAPRAAR
jgi:hypothetical protein